MEKLTAEKARELAASSDAEVIISAILEKVEIAAKEGEYVYITREYGFGEGSCYCAENNWPVLYKKIVRGLRDLGYTANVKSATSQFVDMWLEVSWK